jgi:hypothetical protein
MFCASVLLLAVVTSRSAPSLTASLDRNVVPVGESVTLSLNFQEAAPNGPPALPAMPNLRVTGVSQSQRIGIENGRQSFEFTYLYALVATQPGDVTIPPISVNAGAQTVTSQPLQLKIVPSTAAAAANNVATNFAFLRLVVPKTEVYLGEPFPVEVHLYFRQVEERLSFPQLKADGFSLTPWPQPTRTQTQVGNAIFNLIVFKTSATAARTGTLALGPAQTGVNVLIPAGRRQRGLFDLFEPAYERRPVSLSSETINLNVLPLPQENVPPGFSGAIGNYTLRVSAGPTNVAVGDPITVRVQISGRGALDALALPAQTDWRDFNTYPPTAKVETTDSLGLEGMKAFEQVVIPQNQEIKALPPVRFSFFNPNTRKYVMLSGPTIPLTIRPSGLASAPLPSLTNAAANAAPPPVDDIIHIKPRLEVATVGPLLITRPWFIALQALPALLWVSLLIWRRRADALEGNPRLRRRREVAARVREGLKDLRSHAEVRRSNEFFATLFRLLQEQLGERLDLPATAITEAVIDERLRDRGLSQQTLKALHELFQSCNLARYAPAQTSQELAAIIPIVEAALRDLQSLRP